MTEFAAQRAAISEVLRAIASSPHDLQPIFDAILDNATHLCRAEAGGVRLAEEAALRLVAHKIGPASYTYLPPKFIGFSSFYDALKSPFHVPDVGAHELYRAGDAHALALVEGGIGTALFVPMLRNDELIGAIALVRLRVEPFAENEIELITDFAAEAAIALEITRRERQLRELQMELAHANRLATLGQLAASIAHELNQPLSAIAAGGGATLRWLALQPPQCEEAKGAAAYVIEVTRRAIDIVTGLRDLTKKEVSRRDLVDINDAIADVDVLIHSEALKSHVSVETDLASCLPRVKGDRVQLQQVILNLIVNAIQAMSGFDSDRRELRISTDAADAEGVRVGVQDNGPGLTPESLPRLFEPFYTTKAEGMGMGLAICHSIVEAHGGRLWATACEPHGALFQFTIPAERETTS